MGTLNINRNLLSKHCKQTIRQYLRSFHITSSPRNRVGALQMLKPQPLPRVFIFQSELVLPGWTPHWESLSAADTLVLFSRLKKKLYLFINFFLSFSIKNYKGWLNIVSLLLLLLELNKLKFILILDLLQDKLLPSIKFSLLLNNMMRMVMFGSLCLFSLAFNLQHLSL